MTPAQQGVWIVALALHRGQRHARKQRIRAILSGQVRCVDFSEYDARREARMGGTG